MLEIGCGPIEADAVRWMSSTVVSSSVDAQTPGDAQVPGPVHWMRHAPWQLTVSFMLITDVRV